MAVDLNLKILKAIEMVAKEEEYNLSYDVKSINQKKTMLNPSINKILITIELERIE